MDQREGDWQPIHWSHVEQRTPWVFRATVKISPTMAAEPLAIFVTAVASSEAYWDGQPLAANGEVGGVATEIPGRGIVLFCNERFGRGRMTRLVPLVYLIIAGVTLGLFSGSDMATFLVVITAMACCATLSFGGIRTGQTGAWFALAAILAVAVAMVSDLMIFLDRSLFIALVAIVVAFVVEHIRQSVQTRRERDRAQLRAATLELELLKRHLRPHFLLNSLTLLTEWLETHPQQATRFVDALGKEFRLLNRLMDRPLISLEEEIDLCRAHLKVMELRFETSFTLDVEHDLRGIELPPATLHTLLENAITHNHYLPGQDVRFALHVKHAAAVELQFIAPCGEPRESRTAGSGIETIRSRLKASIGPQAELRWELTSDACITTLEWPAPAGKDVSPVGQRACA